MPTYRLLLEYDGTAFQGWQIQRAGPTVQAALETALATALRAPTDVVGSGRTDAGVHARGQVAHFKAATAVDLFRLRASLNGLLPDAVAVRALEPAPEDFHARYDAYRRTYHYHVATAPRALDRSTRLVLRACPDFDAMNEAARQLIGCHDFDSFCITRSETKNRVCTVERARWEQEPRPGDWRFEIAADRFLHGMVRAIVGTLFQIGRGTRPVGALADILAARNRQAAGPAAPARGLVLERVDYPEPVFQALGT